MVEESPGIVGRDDLNRLQPPPGGTFDNLVDITGVGQMAVRNNPLNTSVGLCTGTLINPRTVIFAAHCVNSRPAEAYGPNGVPINGPHGNNGVPISFGFKADNLPPLIQWINSGHQTQTASAIYNVEQVWYDPRSRGPNSAGFLEADVAIATLDTPAFDIPTWTMLFSPLTQETHVTINGYGASGSGTNGANIGIDFRRRVAENMLSVLGSLNDKNDFLFGANPARPNPQSLYMLDFDSPEGDAGFNPAANKWDFDHFDGAALPREGTTAGGDSGGPLIVDQKFDKPVVAGVLSGGSRVGFIVNGAARFPPFSSYGTTSFYQPLFLFWDQIVANNPYVYAGNKAGFGAWEDAGHWVQLMDPNYAVERNGVLVNDLPDTPALGVSGSTVKFGQICFQDECIDNSEDPEATGVPVGSGTGLVIPGGPGSTDFVPNNVVGNPRLGIKSRYYDVTLSAAGGTTLSSSVTIDRMTVDGLTMLDVRSGGSLNVLGEYDQFRGWTNVDGLLRSGRDMFVLSGLLSGSGTIRAPFVTVVGGVVAPAGTDVGTLTVDGNLILSSGSALFIDAGRSGADRLTVTEMLALDGGALVMNKAKGAAPRHGQSFVIASAAGGIDGTFGNIYSFQGVLRPELTYGANEIVANLRAGSLAQQIGQSGPTERAFAQALDQLRGNFYDNLYGLYGAIDLMGPEQLSMTLRGLTPGINGETRSLQDRQSKVMLSAVTDRLSTLGTGRNEGRLSVVGSPQALAALALPGGAQSVRSFAHGLVPAEAALGTLPEGFSGFVSSGFTANGSTSGDAGISNVAGQRSWHVGMGLEMEVAPRLTVGTAFGYANGYSTPGAEQERADSKTSQMAVYGSYRLGGGAYVAGLASAETSRATMERQASTGEAMFDLYGATNASRYNVQAEAGVNLDVASGLTLTPRASVRYASYRFGGYRENGGELALQIDDLKVRQLESRLGFQLAGSTRAFGSSWTVVPQLQADYVQNLSGAKDGLSVRFASASDVAFALPLAGGDSNWMEVKGGLRLTNGPVEFGAGVESSLGRSDLKDERALADFTFRF